MPWAIILPIVAGVGMSAIGSSQQQGAQDQAARDRNAALQQFTGIQDAEFDRRNKALTDSSKRIGDIKDQSFASLLGARSAAGRENAGIKTKYSNATTGAQLQTADIKDDVDAARNVLRDASDIELADKTGAERFRQLGYQKEGTDLATRLVGNLGVDGFGRDVAYYDPLRQARIATATAGDGTAATPFNVDPTSVYGRALAGQSASSVGMALDAARGRARTSAIGDAATNQGRTINRAEEKVGILGRKAAGSRDALDPEMAAAKLVRENADADADQRKANADADMSSYIKILQDEQTMEESRTGTRQKSIEDLIQQVADGTIKTEEDFINAVNASSLNFEDAVRQLTNFKMGGTVGSSFMGNLLSGAGGSLISAGIGNIGK